MSVNDPYRIRKKLKPSKEEDKSGDNVGVEEGLRDVLPSTEQSKIEIKKRTDENTVA
jgi:hypothetical protein